MGNIEREARIASRDDFLAPRTRLESAIANIWQDVLAQERVGVQDDFFELGGESLAAVHMLAEVDELLLAPVSFADFLDAPTVAGLAAAVALAREQPAPAGPVLEPGSLSDPAPCTFAQERLWFVDQLAGATGAYNEPLGARFRGALDEAALEASLQDLLARHAALRTAFEVRDGTPVQVVRAGVELELTRIDLSGHEDAEGELGRRTEALASAPFDLEHPPLVRAYLLRIAEHDHVLQLVFHHSVTDGGSHVIVLRELSELYRAHTSGQPAALGTPPIQYPDFARWQRARLQGPALEQAIAPWRERLADIPAALELPLDRPRPPVQSHRGATRRGELDGATSEAVRTFSRAEGVTPFMTLLAVFDVLLQRYSGQDTIMIGSATAGRDRPELEDVVGLFANTIVLRNDLSGEPTFRELLSRVRHVVLDAVAHDQAPFEHLVAELGGARDLSRHPIFQVFFSSRPHASLDLPGAEPFNARLGAARADLTVWVEEAPGGFELVWEYATDLFDASTIERLDHHFDHLLRAALGEPQARISHLPLLDAEEREQALKAAAPASAEYPVACLHELFEAQVGRAPDAPAVSCGEERLAYAELDARANQLARHLIGLGVGPEMLVGIAVERTAEMLVGLLGILKAGGAYVPVDPAYPAERQEFMLRSSGATVVVTQERLVAGLPLDGVTVVCLDRDWPAIASQPRESPAVACTPEQLAYVIYTSGSTGQPKGVQIAHRALVNFLTTMGKVPGLGPEDVLVAVTTLSFDIAGLELYLPLLVGAQVVIAPDETVSDPRALGRLLARSRASVMQATPTTWRMLLDSGWKPDRPLKALCGGEPLPVALADRLVGLEIELWNMYGPTETTIWSTCARISTAGKSLTIGRPIANTTLYILDKHLRPVPVGVVGELWIGGHGLARGYRGRDDLTAERFIPDPFADDPGTRSDSTPTEGARIYRTGDLARYRADGDVEFMGRIDNQVKVRGFRIELGEIETVLTRYPGVAEAVVVARVGTGSETELAAYVIPTQEPVEARLLREFAIGTLPAYMVPSTVTTLDAFPLTPNGKVDRKALPEPTRERSAEREYVAPETPTELAIEQIWREVLGVQRVGVQDNFFDLGGHSLLAARVVSKLREAEHLELSVRTLFEHPTLAAFAQRVAAAPPSADSGAGGAPAPGPARSPASEYPLSFQQQQLLFFDQLSPDSIVYNSALAIRVTGELHPELLRQALAAVFTRHEALRTVLVWDEDSARQVVLEDYRPTLACEDISGTPAASGESELRRLLGERARRAFALAGESPLRTTLFRLGPSEHVVLFEPHHVAFDARAVEVLFEELGEAYGALRAKRPAVLPELPLQYGDFALWQRERLQGEKLSRELDFWRAQLAGAPTVLELPTDHRRSSMQTFDGASLTHRLDGELAGLVRERCQTEQVTPYMLLLSSFATLLYRRTGQDDILFGGPMANRDQAGFENLIGFFANTIVVRVRLGGNPTYAELLARVRDSVLESYEHQDVPLELVVDAVRPERDPGVNPLFQVNFRVRVGGPPALDLAGTSTSWVPVDLGLARFDLALELHLLPDGVEAEFNWNTALFERATVERLAADFERLLAQGLSDPDTRLLSLELAAGSGNGNGSGARPVRPGAIRGFRESGRSSR